MNGREDPTALRQLALSLEPGALIGRNFRQRDKAVKVLARLLLEARGLLDGEVDHEDD